LPGLGLIHISEPPASQPASQPATGSRFCLGSRLGFPNLILDRLAYVLAMAVGQNENALLQLDFAIAITTLWTAAHQTSGVQVRIAKINVSTA